MTFRAEEGVSRLLDTECKGIHLKAIYITSARGRRATIDAVSDSHPATDEARVLFSLYGSPRIRDLEK